MMPSFICLLGFHRKKPVRVFFYKKAPAFIWTPAVESIVGYHCTRCGEKWLKSIEHRPPVEVLNDAYNWLNLPNLMKTGKHPFDCEMEVHHG